MDLHDSDSDSNGDSGVFVRSIKQPPSFNEMNQHCYSDNSNDSTASDRSIEQPPTINRDGDEAKEQFKRMLDDLKRIIKELNSEYARRHQTLIGLIKKLNEITDELESMHKGTTVGSLTGAVIGATGGITTIVGLCLIPFTFGASLAIAGVGAGIAAAGGVTGAASNIANMIQQKNFRETIEKITGDFQKTIEPLTEQLSTISTKTEEFQKQQFMLPAIGCYVKSGTCSALLISDFLLDMAQIGKVAAQAAKGLRIAAAAAGVLSALMLAFDIFSIVQDSKEIYQMNLSADKKAQDMTSETLKFIQKMRETAAEYQKIVNDIKSAKDTFNKQLEIINKTRNWCETVG